MDINVPKFAGMCIWVEGVCVGKATGNIEIDTALRDFAQNLHPKDGRNYEWDENGRQWVLIE